MAKKSFDLGRFVKAAKKEICYKMDGADIYLCDEQGHFGMQTSANGILAELEKRGAALHERAGLKNIFQINLAKYKPEDMFTYANTGIQLPYLEKKSLTVFRDPEQDGFESVKVADTEFVNIFSPQIINGGKHMLDPLIMICDDCYGLVMTVRQNGRTALTKDLCCLYEYYQNL